MKNRKKALVSSIALLLITFIFTTIASCDKIKDDDKPKAGSELRSFSHLHADNDTLYIGQKTNITAIYDGDDVKFEWDASAGDILGSGNKIEYIAPVCASGSNIVLCTAIAENTSIVRSIVIHVY